MIKISRSHPIKLKYGQHYPREMLRTAFRKTRTACQQQSAERLLADVTDDEGMPLFTLVYEKNYLQKNEFSRVPCADGFWSYDFLHQPLDELDLTLLKRYSCILFFELEEYTFAVMELLLRPSRMSTWGGHCIVQIHFVLASFLNEKFIIERSGRTVCRNLVRIPVLLNR